MEAGIIEDRCPACGASMKRVRCNGCDGAAICCQKCGYVDKSHVANRPDALYRFQA